MRRMIRMLVVVFAAVTLAAVVAAVACGDAGSERGDPSPTDRLTAQARTPAPNSPTPAFAQPTVAPGTAAPAPTPVPTLDPRVLGEVNALGRLALAEGDLPAGFVVQRSQRALKADIVAAQISIPELALFLRDSSLAGAWAALYARADESQQAGLSSIVFLFGTPEDARAFVEANANIRAEDYLFAIEVQQVQAETIGDAAHLVRYRLTDGRSLEYTWAQGKLAGQVILRYTQDGEGPDDAGTVVGLARIQSTKMAEFLR